MQGKNDQNSLNLEICAVLGRYLVLLQGEIGAVFCHTGMDSSRT
jgi:hypothetical protein